MARPSKHDGVVYKRNNSSIWWMRYRDKTGRRRLETTNTADWDEAQRYLRERLKARDDNALDVVRKGKQITFSEWADFFLENYSQPPLRAAATHVCTVAALRTLRPAFGSMRLADIDATQIEAHLRQLSGGDTRPNEIFAVENGRLRQLTHQNDELFANLDIPPTEDVSFKSKDGTEVHGLLTKPVGYVAGTKVPLLLRIHGGPNGQDAHSFSSEKQWFTAHGYAVLAVNYRGSAGRGQKYSRAIFADWGHYEVEDLEAGVDSVIRAGVADPARLGVGGWSYGAILTDYMIATDTRFKVATSGAGTAFTVAFYGTDQYIIQYDYEIGPPWKNFDTYVKLSYPFLHADRIKTPTLFLGGERDFNVPVQGGQQMYQALRSLGIDTQLIIYPNETHGIQRPSYQRDRLERYLAWYDKYLKGGAGAAAPAAQR